MGFLLTMAGWPLALDVGSILHTLPLHLERYLVKRTESENEQNHGTQAVEHVSGNSTCLWLETEKEDTGFGVSLHSPSQLYLLCFVIVFLRQGLVL